MILKELLALREKEEELDLDLEDTGDSEEKKPDSSNEPVEPKETAPEEKKIESFGDLFDANSADVKVYTRRDLFDAMKLTQKTAVTANGKRMIGNKGDYVLRNHDDIKDISIVSGEDFDGTYEQVRQTDKPDAEGFILVKHINNAEAFEYKGEPLSLDNEWNETVDIKKGMYVVRYEGDDGDSGWSVPRSEFNKAFKEKH